MPGKDTYPEAITVTTNPITTALTWTSTTAEIPLMNLPSAGKNSARVIEILSIYITPLVSLTSPTYLAIGGIDYAGNTTTAVPTSQSAQDMRNFFWTKMPIEGAANIDKYIDLTDDKGHGLLFPGPNIVFNTVSAATLNEFRIQVLYRVKSLGLSEWVGIVNQYQLQF